MDVDIYCGKDITASGTHIRPGVCAAKKDWLGKTAVLYDENMNYIASYQIEDTSKEDDCISVFIDDANLCKNFKKKPVFVQIVDTVG